MVALWCRDGQAGYMKSWKKHASVACLALAVIEISAGDSSPLPYYVSPLLILLSMFFRFAHQNPITGPLSIKSFIAGFRPLPCCKSAFVEMWVGAGFVVAGTFEGRSVRHNGARITRAENSSTATLFLHDQRSKDVGNGREAFDDLVVGNDWTVSDFAGQEFG